MADISTNIGTQRVDTKMLRLSGVYAGTIFFRILAKYQETLARS